MGLEADVRKALPTRSFDDFFRSNFAAVARSAALVARDPGTGQDAAQEAFARLFGRWSDMNDEEHAPSLHVPGGDQPGEVPPA